MNFLAHAEVARRASDGSVPFVLGAVLPDLLPMAGVRVVREHVPAPVAEGWAEHHRADAAFHAHPAFVAGVGALRTDLRATALGTGPRRAAAHVGWELLLDDVLAGADELVSVFREALLLGRTVSPEPAWHDLLDRFAALRPSGPAAPEVLAERVRQACSRRARLAFGPEHLDDLAGVLDGHRADVADLAPSLLAEVAQPGSIP